MLRATVSFCFNLDCKREREREREGEREGGREGGREGERERGREGERGREREREGELVVIEDVCRLTHCVLYLQNTPPHTHTFHTLCAVCVPCIVHTPHWHIGVLVCQCVGGCMYRNVWALI